MILIQEWCADSRIFTQITIWLRENLLRTPFPQDLFEKPKLALGGLELLGPCEAAGAVTVLWVAKII